MPVPLSHFFLRLFLFIHLIISILASKIMHPPPCSFSAISLCVPNNRHNFVATKLPSNHETDGTEKIDGGEVWRYRK